MAKDDGGPAFPCQSEHMGGNVYKVITQGGMTLRDYFAAKAMQGMMSCQDFMNDQVSKLSLSKEEACANVARWSYIAADAMLAERQK